MGGDVFLVSARVTESTLNTLLGPLELLERHAPVGGATSLQDGLASVTRRSNGSITSAGAERRTRRMRGILSEGVRKSGGRAFLCSENVGDPHVVYIINKYIFHLFSKGPCSMY